MSAASLEENKSIALLTCYIGKLPWYFDYYIHSCKFNPSIDFYIITDDITYSNPAPTNVKIIIHSLEEINTRASQKLGITTNIKRGYKLCDFKPTYGILFSELIQGYDFWGHGDIDVIFGDIRGFITDDILTRYELINVRHDYLTGQFLLFKNNEKMNNLFKLSKDYKRVLGNEKNYCFDETNFQWQGFKDGKKYHEIPSEVESMTHLVRRLAQENYLRVHFDFVIIEGLPGKLLWHNGRLYYKRKYETLMYHMVVFKKVCKPIKHTKPLPATFNISASRINHTKKNLPTWD
jgi:hypothetical protein